MPHKHKLPERCSLVKNEPSIIEDTRQNLENINIATLPPLYMRDDTGYMQAKSRRQVVLSPETDSDATLMLPPVDKIGYLMTSVTPVCEENIGSKMPVPPAAEKNIPVTIGSLFTLGRDLVYGKGDQITNYAAKNGDILGLGKTESERLVTMMFMDHKGKTVFNAQHVFNGDDNIFSKSLKYEDTNPDKFNAYKEKFPQVTIDFYNYRQNPYSHYYAMRPSNVGGETKKSEGGYVDMASTPGLSPLQLESISRKSKGLLESTLSNGGNIHFLLDGIDIQQIINKHDGPDGSNTVAANELRWLYRHKDEVDVMPGTVIFKKNNAVVPAPWVQAPEQWFQYNSKS